MPASTQTVIIDFQADFSSVEDAVNVLEKTGKVDAALAASFRKTNQEIKAQGAALDKTAQSATKEGQSFSKLSQLMQQFPKSGLNRFLLQVGNELAAAGLKAEDFFDRTTTGAKDLVPKFTSLRQELTKVKEQMQQALLSGGALSDEYKRLKARAGELDDTIKDVSSDISNAGSDTRGIDNVVGSMSALAGGFSAIQGAAALFGDESEDLQRALLKVNAAMALATGLQQVSNALTKQGALVRLADTAATYTQIYVQKIYTFVTGRATAATVAFKLALAATGIGLAIVLIIALSKALQSETTDMDNATDAIDRQAKSIDALNEGISRRTALAIAEAEKQGKAESDLIRIRGRGIQQQVSVLEESNALLIKQRDSVDATSEAWFTLNAQISKNNETISGLNNDVLITSLKLQQQQIEDSRKALDDKERSALAGVKNDKKVFDIQQSFDRQRLQSLKDQGADIAVIRQKETDLFVRQREFELNIARKQRAALFELEKEKISTRLVGVQKGSIEEFELKKKFLQLEKTIALENDNLTSNERKVVLQNFLKEKIQLEKEHNKQSLAQANEDEKSRINAVLSNLNLSEEKRLQLTIDFLRISADAEKQASEVSAAKVKEINAKLNTDIAQAKVAAIKKSADEEQRILAAILGPSNRALEVVAQNEKFKSAVRISAIKQLQQAQVDAIDRDIAANRKANDVIGADHRSLNIEYEELLDKKAQATEAAEARITGIVEAENKKRKDSDIAYIQSTLSGLQEISSIIANVQANNQAASEQAIAAQKQKVDDLLEAGAITEKEADKRNKRIEAQERGVRIRAAQQQKQLALFNALIAIPQAVISGLTAPFPIGGPIYAAILGGLAAAQAVVIASRPVPKFSTGKKGSYKGLGQVGEAGAELIERADGSMEVATKKTITYLGPKDKVFTASETKTMMPFVNKEVIAASGKTESVNYDKIAAAIIKGYRPSPGANINIDKDFISESVADGLRRVNYFNRYYSSK